MLPDVNEIIMTITILTVVLAFWCFTEYIILKDAFKESETAFEFIFKIVFALCVTSGAVICVIFALTKNEEILSIAGNALIITVGAIALDFIGFIFMLGRKSKRW